MAELDIFLIGVSRCDLCLILILKYSSDSYGCVLMPIMTILERMLDVHIRGPHAEELGREMPRQSFQVETFWDSISYNL